jgi:hypothetical protein
VYATAPRLRAEAGRSTFNAGGNPYSRSCGPGYRSSLLGRSPEGPMGVRSDLVRGNGRSPSSPASGCIGAAFGRSRPVARTANSSASSPRTRMRGGDLSFQAHACDPDRRAERDLWLSDAQRGSTCNSLCLTAPSRSSLAASDRMQWSRPRACTYHPEGPATSPDHRRSATGSVAVLRPRAPQRLLCGTKPSSAHGASRTSGG